MKWDWTRFKRKNKLFFKTVLIVFPLFALSTPIHEIGHVLIAQSFNIEIEKVALFEVNLSLNYPFFTLGYVRFVNPPTFPNPHYIIQFFYEIAWLWLWFCFFYLLLMHFDKKEEKKYALLR